MSDIDYLNESQVADVRRGEAPRHYSASGYGNKIPTQWEIKIGSRWHRVYVIQWSNAGSAYVIVGGKRLFLGSFDPAYYEEKRGKHGRY